MTQQNVGFEHMAVWHPTDKYDAISTKKALDCNTNENHTMGEVRFELETYVLEECISNRVF